jgi:hypothetical protein
MEVHMAIDWQKLPKFGPGAPFNGQQVLLAVPNRVGDAWGVDGLTLDTDFPFTVYLGRWDKEAGWATTETDEDSDGILRLPPEQPTFWACWTCRTSSLPRHRSAPGGDLYAGEVVPSASAR